MLACDALSDHTQQKVARVAVQVLFTGREVQPALTDDQVKQFFFRVQVFVGQATQIHQGQVIAQAAGVMDKMPERDRIGIAWHLGQVLAHTIIQRQVTPVFQDSDDRGSELLTG